jgi:hypothetical protein
MLQSSDMCPNPANRLPGPVMPSFPAGGNP